MPPVSATQSPLRAMNRRQATLGILALPMSDARADATSPQLAAYYDRHALLLGDRMLGWEGRGRPRLLRDGVVQAGVSKDAWLALDAAGVLWRWSADAARATRLRDGVARFAAGASGWIAIDRDGAAWQAGTDDRPVRLSPGSAVVDACVGDSADYLVTADGRLHVKGLAHRGQYGDGLLRATEQYASTATDVVAVRAHTGHAIHLRRDGVVMGTGGNRYGPLSSHGLGDKADRWGPIFDRAVAIATGSRHSLALRADGSLWGWGEGFAIQPARLMERVRAAAAGDTVTLALATDGALWQWNAGRGPERVALPG